MLRSWRRVPETAARQPLRGDRWSRSWRADLRLRSRHATPTVGSPPRAGSEGKRRPQFLGVPAPPPELTASNLILAHETAGNLKPTKDKSTERIDGIVAAIMAIGRALVAQEEPQPEYSLFFV